MRTSRSPQIAYFVPREDSFWRWSGDGRAIEWRDGRTISFREEAFSIVRRLAPSGLPPFGSIVLLLAATRDNWHRCSDNVSEIIKGYCYEAGSSAQTQMLIGAVVSHRARQELVALVGDLEAVAAIPRRILDDANAVRSLAEMVFSGAPAS